LDNSSIPEHHWPILCQELQELSSSKPTQDLGNWNIVEDIVRQEQSPEALSSLKDLKPLAIAIKASTRTMFAAMAGELHREAGRKG